MKELSNKVCIVTGSTRGIGKAVAMKFAENGADVIMMDINKDLLHASAEQIAEKWNEKTYPVYVDAASTSSVNEAMDEAEHLAGTADILANCAGISTSKKLIDVEDPESVFTDFA